MYEEIGKADQSAFYSDVREAGGLGPAIQAQLEAMGSPLRVKESDPEFAGMYPFDWESVRRKHRCSQIKTAKHRRLFMLDFWDRGICLAGGSTPSLPEVAQVIHAWVAQEVLAGELRRRFPLAAVEPNAESHEQGAAAEVERKWQTLYSHVRSERHMSELVPLVEKAMEVPVLRRLFPYTSLISLCFSRCTGFPFSRDCPSACPSKWAVHLSYLTSERRAALGPGKPYSVAGPNRHFLGQGDAAEAIELIVRHLPPNCGPAVQGTAEDPD